MSENPFDDFPIIPFFGSTKARIWREKWESKILKWRDKAEKLDKLHSSERKEAEDKPKLTLDQFAIAITSDVRLAIIEELSLTHEYAGEYFTDIKMRISVRLDRLVSNESLTWHLEKLKDNKIIEEITVVGYPIWNLTSIGKEIFNLVEKVNREMEEAEGR